MTLVIREERRKRGWTLHFVAQQIGISKAAYRNIETGERKPSYDVMTKLLAVYGYSDPRLLFAMASQR